MNGINILAKILRPKFVFRNLWSYKWPGSNSTFQKYIQQNSRLPPGCFYSSIFGTGAFGKMKTFSSKLFRTISNFFLQFQMLGSYWV